MPALNGCGKRIVAPEKILRDAGVGGEEIQAAVCIASVVHAVAATLDAGCGTPPSANGEAHEACASWASSL